jgi:hypothetical protein
MLCPVFPPVRKMARFHYNVNEKVSIMFFI